MYGEGIAQRVWGMALAAGTDDDQAESHLLASLQALESGECRAEVARTQLAWARLYLGRGNRAAALAQAESAAKTFADSAMLGDLQQAHVLQQQLQ